MLTISADEARRWRIEIEQAEKFKEDEFGSCAKGQIRGVGENIGYFENGYSSRYLQEYSKRDPNYLVPLNIVYPVVKNVIPSLYYKNPYIVSIPKRKADEDSAPYCSAIINHYFRQLDVKRINQQVLFDAYMLGFGVCKIGYATRFGLDMEDKERDSRREEEKKKGLLEMLGLRKPKSEEPLPRNMELNEFIVAESPYVTWVSPFNFGIDPMASSIYEANYVYEKITTTLDRVKANKNYHNTKDLRGIDLEPGFVKDIPVTQIDKFKPIELYEVHYKTDEGINILVLAKDQSEYVALRHDENVYDIDGFQYELLTFNKHGHKLYPRSEIDIIKPLQDRVNNTFENILEQLDKFMTKLAYDETGVTPEGKIALRDGMLGSLVGCNKNPADVIKEISMTQVKGDLMLIIDKMIDIISLETGITRAMLTGLTSAETATEAQIGQAGQNLRLSDKADMVSDFSNRQARKLWQVIRQFVDLEKVELITGETAYDDVTGTPRYSWLEPIDKDMRYKLITGEYDQQIEVGSTQKPDLPVLRKQVENLVNILGGKGVLEAFAAQGYKIELAEIFKKYLLLFPDVFTNISRIIKPIQQAPTGIPQGQPPMGNPPLGTTGGGIGAVPQQVQKAPPNPADIMSEIGGEKGGNIPIA
jgi:hypothetical protein